MRFLGGIKWKLYALIAGAFILGLIGWRNNAVSRALDAEKAKVLAAKLKKSEEMRDAAREIDTSKRGLSERLRDHKF